MAIYFNDGTNTTKYTSKYFRYLLTNNIGSYTETTNAFDNTEIKTYSIDEFVSTVVENIPDGYSDKYFALLSLNRNYALALGYLIIEGKATSDDVSLILGAESNLARQELILDLLETEKFNLLDVYQVYIKKCSYTSPSIKNIYFVKGNTSYNVTRKKLMDIDSDLMKNINYTPYNNTIKKVVDFVNSTLGKLINESMDYDDDSKIITIKEKDIVSLFFNKYAFPLGFIDFMNNNYTNYRFRTLTYDFVEGILYPTLNSLDNVKDSYYESDLFTKEVNYIMNNYTKTSNFIFNSCFPNTANYVVAFNSNKSTYPSAASFIDEIKLTNDAFAESIVSRVIDACTSLNFNSVNVPSDVKDLINFDINISYEAGDTTKFYINKLPNAYYSYVDRFNSIINKAYSTTEADDLGKEYIIQKLLSTIDSDYASNYTYEEDSSLAYNIYKYLYFVIFKNGFRNYVSTKTLSKVEIDETTYKVLLFLGCCRNAINSTILVDRKLCGYTVDVQSNNAKGTINTTTVNTAVKYTVLLYNDIDSIVNNILKVAGNMPLLTVLNIKKTVENSTVSLKKGVAANVKKK